ncbi:hypothetical protein DC74_5430 [Streptomyces noursei]|nr:hypothetical protein DC74_5430 [Streptomyces noursei]
MALSRPVPAPSEPVMRLAPHWPVTRRSSKALVTAPVVVPASTLASAGSGSRMAISPETVVRSICAPADGSRSRTMSPLTESACTASPVPSTTVRSPETELNRRSPVRACASTLPATVSARTGPESPTRVLSPLTPRSSVRPETPEMTTPAPTTPTSTRVVAGTVTDTTALRFQPLRSRNFKKPFHGRSS